jgi:hypothetical protein
MSARATGHRNPKEAAQQALFSWREAPMLGETAELPILTSDYRFLRGSIYSSVLDKHVL